MNYIAELKFLQKILENMHIHTSLLQEPYEHAELHDLESDSLFILRLIMSVISKNSAKPIKGTFFTRLLMNSCLII